MGFISDLLDRQYQLDIRRYEQGFPLPPIIEALQNQRLPQATIKWLVRYRYQAAHYFADLVHGICGSLQDSIWYSDLDMPLEVAQAAVEVLSENLKEEMGEQEGYGGSHRESRLQFIKAVGFNDLDFEQHFPPFSGTSLGQNVTFKPAARHMLSHFRDIASCGGVSSLIFLWMYEYRISMEGRGDYCLMLSECERQHPDLKRDVYEPGDALWHIYSHAELDDEHGKELYEVLCSIDGHYRNRFVSPDLLIPTFLKACSYARYVIDTFWILAGDLVLQFSD